MFGIVVGSPGKRDKSCLQPRQMTRFSKRHLFEGRVIHHVAHVLRASHLSSRVACEPTHPALEIGATRRPGVVVEASKPERETPLALMLQFILSE